MLKEDGVWLYLYNPEDKSTIKATATHRICPVKAKADMLRTKFAATNFSDIQGILLSDFLEGQSFNRKTLRKD